MTFYANLCLFWALKFGLCNMRFVYHPPSEVLTLGIKVQGRNQGCVVNVLRVKLKTKTTYFADIQSQTFHKFNGQRFTSIWDHIALFWCIFGVFIDDKLCKFSRVIPPKNIVVFFSFYPFFFAPQSVTVVAWGPPQCLQFSIIMTHFSLFKDYNLRKRVVVLLVKKKNLLSYKEEGVKAFPYSRGMVNKFEAQLTVWVRVRVITAKNKINNNNLNSLILSVYPYIFVRSIF